MNLVLANRDYGPAGKGWGAHMSDEGMQLQEGLHHAGWTLSGLGFDNMLDVREILKRYQPECVLVSDKRDFDPRKGAFRKDLMFHRLEDLAKHPEVFKVAVVKDAHPANAEYHRNFAREIGADAALTYYHDRSIIPHGPWLSDIPRIRHYHTVDAEKFRAIPFQVDRKRVILSGARDAGSYPLRERMAQAAAQLDCYVKKHPGYNNHGCMTYRFAAELAGYRVHLATASRYGFALRKIIESVALGVTPITDLPPYDVLPEIDEALVRIPSSIRMAELRGVIDHCAATWDAEERRHFAEKALAFYDWRAMGRRTHISINAARLLKFVTHAGNAVPAH